MPPKRRRNQPQARSPPRQPSPSPDRDHSPSEDADDDDDQRAPLLFYNTTFSAHRVSPLYLGSEPLTPNRLQILAQLLRDRLVGDVVRGVEVGAGAGVGMAADGEDGSIVGRAGALEGVEIEWVRVADVLGFSREELEELGAVGEEEEEGAANWRLVASGLVRKRALHIALRYELASCTAVLLPPLSGDGEEEEGSPAWQGKMRFSVGCAGPDEMDWEQSVDPARFLTLPLLLLRMPVPLKAILGDFLSTTFDCRVSPMRLGTRSLVRSWEAWIRSAGLPSRGPRAKDVVLSLGFYVPPPDKPSVAPRQPSEEEATSADQQQSLGLRSIEVIIPAAELNKFVATGKRLAKARRTQTRVSADWGWEGDLKKRRKLAGRLYEEGWEWRTKAAEGGGSPEAQPFTEALACYLKDHLGLNLFHPGVRIIKIACGGFAMSESRLKLFTPTATSDAEEEDLLLLGQRSAVLELLGDLVGKAQAHMAAA